MINMEEEMLVFSNSCHWNSLLWGDSALCLNIELNNFSRFLKFKLVSKPENILKNQSNVCLSHCHLSEGLKDANGNVEDVVNHPLAISMFLIWSSNFFSLLIYLRAPTYTTWHLRLFELLIENLRMSLDMENREWYGHMALHMEPRKNKQEMNSLPRAFKMSLVMATF